MNRPIVINLAWLLVAVATFVTGSRLAGPSSGDSGGSKWNERSNRAQEPYSMSGKHLGPESPRETDFLSAGQLAENGSEQAETNLIWNPQVAESVRNILRRAAKDSAPLDKIQIKALVLASIKSSNPVDRRQAFDRILEEMASESFSVDLAMSIRETMFRNSASGEQWRLFDYAWGANDPAAALAYIDEIPPQFRDGYTGNMLPGLASVQPQTAIDLVSNMETSLRNQITGRLIEGLVDSNNVGMASDYVYQLAQDGDTSASRHMRTLAREVLGNQGLQEGVEWAGNLQEGPLQAAALVQVAHEYANEDPVAAAAWSEQYVGNDQNSRIFGEIVREWGNWYEASVWVERLEPSRAQRDALSAVYGFRGATEPHEAVREIEAMPPSDDRNFAINGFISGLAHQDGETAVIWAGEITSPGMREEAQVRAGRQFYLQNQQAATEWFSNSGLPETRWQQIAGSQR